MSAFAKTLFNIAFIGGFFFLLDWKGLLNPLPAG
jgi:hypothetical protein